MTRILLHLLILFLIFSNDGFAQKSRDTEVDISFVTATAKVQPFIPELPGTLMEMSGLLVYRDLFWGFNDSGGRNILYACDKSGSLVMEVEIENAGNDDWESIAQDEEHIYVGDFGNNRGDRQNLRVYKIRKNDIQSERHQKVKAELIAFEYESQQSFASPVNGTPYDCEAMAFYDGKLQLFSKNWKDRTTEHYRLPVQSGKYKLKSGDSFDVHGLVTGADFSPDGKTLALLQYENWKIYLWLFTDFEGTAFLQGNSQCIYLKNLDSAQAEGVSFLNKDTVLLSCEETKSFKQQVFLLDLRELANGTHPN